MNKRFYILLIYISILLKTTIFAHKDYSGDINPFVFTQNDTFIVQFYNNAEDAKYISKYNSDGKVIIEREKIEEFISTPKTTSIQFQFDSTKYNFNIHNQKYYLLINGNLLKRISKPFILVYDNNSIIDTIAIYWNNYSNPIINRFIIDDENIIGLIKEKYSRKFSFFKVKLDKQNKPIYKTIGKPFMGPALLPKASDVIIYGKYAVIVWINKNGRFLITAWNLETEEIKQYKIKEIKESNTSPELAMINGKMIISYHSNENVKEEFRSEVKNIFLDFPFEE